MLQQKNLPKEAHKQTLSFPLMYFVSGDLEGDGVWEKGGNKCSDSEIRMDQSIYLLSEGDGRPALMLLIPEAETTSA